MMTKIEKFFYSVGTNAQMIALPYGQGRMRMLVVLPAENTNMSVFLANLDGEKLARIRQSLSSRAVNLFLPRFRISFGTYNLNDNLKKLGIGRIFADGDGDFSRMAEDPSGFYVSKILHRAIGR